MPRYGLLLALCWACTACPSKTAVQPDPPTPPPTATATTTVAPQPVPAPSGDDCTAACSTLKSLGCPEGTPDAGQSCVDVCHHTQATHLTDLHPACLAAAKTKEQARTCGSVKCL